MTKRRWKRNGPDYETGCQVFRNDIYSGPGGLLGWMHDHTYRAFAWTLSREHCFKRHYKSLDAAKRAVGKWLDRQELE